MDIVLELLKIILPAGLVFGASYLLVKSFLENDQKRRDYDARKVSQSTMAPLRLQAYERVIIFLERINPNTMVVRVNKQGFSAQQLQMELIKAIKSEYEHNLAQQIYMSHAAWELVKNAKEEILKLINISATKIAHDAPGNDLAMMILNITSNLGKKLPSEVAIDAIKREVNQVF
ncbi:MAG: hypothetical protein IT236_10195 [Bacteroidia bacterium]|nr:hypothetical protein [Bacteroidia bacterium]